jgi:hypothetical protein
MWLLNIVLAPSQILTDFKECKHHKFIKDFFVKSTVLTGMYAASLLTTIFGQDMQTINLIITIFFVWFKLSNKPVLIFLKIFVT